MTESLSEAAVEEPLRSQHTAGPDAEYMTTEEVGALLRTPVETVRWWHKTGKGPRSFKVGRRRLYPRTEVEAFIRAAMAAEGTPAAS